MAVPNKRERITCYECNSSYAIDLQKVPEDRQHFQCIKCGAQIPILRRLLKSKAHADSSPPSAAQPKAPEPQPSAHEAGFYGEDWYGSPSMALMSEGEEDQGGWLATYGDMMSILLIFFILMFAISSIDKKKFQTVMSSVNAALGGEGMVAPQAIGPTALPERPPEKMAATLLDHLKQSQREEENTMSDLREQLERFIAERQLQGKFTVVDENEALIVIAQDMNMFDSGSAEIREDVKPLLQQIGTILKQINNDIVVEGHTDDTPIHNKKFSSNWELSVMRATNVIHFLIKESGMDPLRLTAAGYAFYRPRYSFTSPEREKNRRTEVLIRKKYGGKIVDELIQSHP